MVLLPREDRNLHNSLEEGVREFRSRDAGVSICRPKASRSAATPIRHWLVLGAESLFGAGSALRLIRPTSNFRTPSARIERWGGHFAAPREHWETLG